jgi:predicted RNase H-like HicB family nuclease
MVEHTKASGLAHVVATSPSATTYAVVIEAGPTSFGAYVPDLPGCVAVGETLEEAVALIAEAIPFHLQGLRQDGDPVPEPRTRVAIVTVGTQADNAA